MQVFQLRSPKSLTLCCVLLQFEQLFGRRLANAGCRGELLEMLMFEHVLFLLAARPIAWEFLSALQLRRRNEDGRDLGSSGAARSQVFPSFAPQCLSESARRK